MNIIISTVHTGVVLRVAGSSQEGDKISSSKSTVIEGDREKGDGGVTGDNADPAFIFGNASDLLSLLSWGGKKEEKEYR